MYIKIFHTHPSVADTIVGPYSNDEEMEKDLENNGWTKNESNWEKEHSKGWGMCAKKMKPNYSRLSQLDNSH